MTYNIRQEIFDGCARTGKDPSIAYVIYQDSWKEFMMDHRKETPPPSIDERHDYAVSNTLDYIFFDDECNTIEPLQKR